MSRTMITEMPRTAMLRVFGASALALGLLLAANAAVAQEPRCAIHDDISRVLEQHHAEVPVALGLSSAGKLVQVFSTEDGATWTLVLTRPDGLSCIVAAGRHWEMAAPDRLGPEA